MAWRRAVSTVELVISNWPSEVGYWLWPWITGDLFACCEEELPNSGVSNDCIWVTGTWNHSGCVPLGIYRVKENMGLIDGMQTVGLHGANGHNRSIEEHVV